MIHIDRSKLQTPDFLTSDSYAKLINQLWQEGNEHDCNKYYVDKIFQNLIDCYHQKCAYCECNIISGAVLECDHYRPKKGIKNTSHTGYYWLSYEWTNLIPTCPRCNRAKSNQFPIAGNRVEASSFSGEWNPQEAIKYKTDSTLLKEENPLLLNPEIDDPAEHLKFLPNGELSPITDRGKTTIDVCALNRPGLVAERYKVIRCYYFYICRLFNDCYVKKKMDRKNLIYNLDYIFIKMGKRGSPQKQFSKLGGEMYDQFDLFFIARIKPKFRKKLSIAITNFKKYGTCGGHGPILLT